MRHSVVYFLDHFPTLGGAAHTLLRQAILMKNEKCDVAVIVSNVSGKICEDYLGICQEAELPTVTVRYSVATQPESIDICSVLESYEAVEGFLRKRKPDIVHSVQLNTAVELACRKLHIPHVMSIYPGMPEFFRISYADVFPHYHICDSLYYAKFWHTYAGTESYCVRTMAPDGFCYGKNLNKKNFRFICVGSIYEMKNQLEVIKAFGKVVLEGVCGKLDLWGPMGDNVYWEQCITYIKENRLEDMVSLHGSTSDMEDVYRGSDVLICGSRRESYPNVVSEAMAHGLVVLSTPVAGVPEVLKDGENGYLCEGYEAAHILQKIKQFVKDCESGHINTIVENAEKTWREVHSPQAVMTQLSQCYEDIQEGFAHRDVQVQYLIEDLKKEFDEIIDIFKKNRGLLSYPEWVKKYLWKIKYVIDVIRKSKPYANCFIWGTGKYGGIYKEILDVFVPDINFIGFIDSYKTGSFMGHPVIKPEQIPDKTGCIVLVGVLNQRQQVLDELIGYGFRYNEDMFIWDALNW